MGFFDVNAGILFEWFRVNSVRREVCIEMKFAEAYRSVNFMN